MIGHIRGKVLLCGERFVLLDVSGVGYKVHATSETLERANAGLGDELALFTHTVVREDALDLYGFPRQEELHFFELLIGVSGIGPKGALAVLTVAPVDVLVKAIVSGDTSYMVKVSGIGKKTAQKIALELKDKLKKNLALFGESGGASAFREESDALDALCSLGYSLPEAREALGAIPPKVENTSARIKEALKLLGASK